MSGDVIEDWFGIIEGRPELLPERISGAISVDLESDGEVQHWRIELNSGNLRVSHNPGAADCVISANREVFRRIILGQDSIQAAAYRTDVLIDGQFLFTALMRRLLPGPPDAWDPREFVKMTRKRGGR